MSSDESTKSPSPVDGYEILIEAEENSVNEFGSEKSQLLRMVSWPFQLGLLWIAFCFRYSTEASAYFCQWWYAELPILDWRPSFLDWGPLPLCLAVSVIIFLRLFKSLRHEQNAIAPGRVGTLICTAGFALSGATNESFIFTLIGIWLCVAVSVKLEEDSPFSVALSSFFLIFCCLLSTYMLVQHGLTLIELILISGSIFWGACSTGFIQQRVQRSSTFMGIWFSILLLLSWKLLPQQPSIRAIVQIELSAAFILGRYALLSYIQRKTRFDDSAHPVMRT